MGRLIIAAALLLAACAPTSAQLLTAGQWSTTARRSCLADGRACGPAVRCSSAVVIMSAEGAGQRDARGAGVACAGIREPTPTARALFGELGELVGTAAKIATAHAREREQTRLAVAAQAAADLRVELARTR